MSPTPAEQAEARVFWENFNANDGASSMVREFINKERAVPEPILSNEVNIPKYNIITIAYIVGACELCFLAGYLIGRAM